MGLDIPVVGYLPEDPCFRMESRHLGLVTPQEMDGLKARMQEAGNLLARTVDLKLVREIAGKAVRNSGREEGSEKIRDHVPVRRKIRLGIARDEAFCFYYKDNLTLLEDLGCILVPFSPLRDSALPDALDGLILGGGYPELHGKELAENKGMLSSVREALEAGMPCLAECGGFMYLHEEMEDGEGNAYPMAGVIPGRTFPAGKLVRFGYINVSAADEGDPASDGKDARLNGPQVQTKEPQAQGQWYLRPGESIRGHEFHYWDSTDSGHGCEAVKPDGRRRWKCIHAEGNLFAGYPHLYLPSLPVFAERFVKRCAERRRGGSGGKEDEAERSIG